MTEDAGATFRRCRQHVTQGLVVAGRGRKPAQINQLEQALFRDGNFLMKAPVRTVSFDEVLE
jgi:hypothetical protein